MKLSFSFSTHDSRPKGTISILRDTGMVQVLDQQLGIAFASDGVLTLGEQKEVIHAIASLQHALTLGIEEILDAQPMKEGGKYHAR